MGKPAQANKLFRAINKYFLVCLMIIYSHHTDAQEMLGLTLSSNNGINTTFINPALATGSRAYLEVNILSGNTFFENEKVILNLYVG